MCYRISIKIRLKASKTSKCETKYRLCSSDHQSHHISLCTVSQSIALPVGIIKSQLFMREKFFFFIFSKRSRCCKQKSEFFNLLLAFFHIHFFFFFVYNSVTLYLLIFNASFELVAGCCWLLVKMCLVLICKKKKNGKNKNHILPF